MEPGFCRAGKPIVSKKQREEAVRPQDEEPNQLLQTLDKEESGDLGVGGKTEETDPWGEVTRVQWRKWQTSMTT